MFPFCFLGVKIRFQARGHGYDSLQKKCEMARWLGLCFCRHHYMQNDDAERTAEANMGKQAWQRALRAVELYAGRRLRRRVDALYLICPQPLYYPTSSLTRANRRCAPRLRSRFLCGNISSDENIL
jgi:hypothetical protein